MKKILFMVIVFLTAFIVSCTASTITSNFSSSSSTTTTSQTSATNHTTLTTTETATTNTTTAITTQSPDEGISEVLGIEDQTISVNHYYHVMKDISATSTYGKDLTPYIHVEGFVDYGTLGTYDLTYSLSYNDSYYEKSVTVSVTDDPYVTPTGARPIGLEGRIVLMDGSYSTGSNPSLIHPRNPSNIENDLLKTAVPSSGWWTSLLVANYGGGNGIYTNPLRTSFANEGLEITNPLDGFVQYWNVGGVQTIAQFPIALKDGFIKSNDLGLGYLTQVIDYSEAHVKVAMRNHDSTEDHVVVTLVQGSPYVFFETANKDALTYKMDSLATIEYYTLDGQLINSSTHSANAIIVKMVQRHSGYTNSPPANVGPAEYTDKFYLVNAPNQTTFTISNKTLSMSLGEGNFISVAAINQLSEAAFYHEHGYTMMTDMSIDYKIDNEQSLVYTDYVASTQQLQPSASSLPLQALMPHHYKYSNASTSDYSYRTVRGTLKVMEGNYFQTVLSFNGLLPGFTLPDNAGFSSQETVLYLEDLHARTEISDTSNFLNDEGPYWNSKALYPLSQGIIIADQLGEDDLKHQFIGKLRYLLADWYTYTDATDQKYLYYNNAWGSVYYSNDDFGTASSLSDHAFTHGYLVYASAVLAMYDDQFIEDYGLIVELLLDDYLYPNKDHPNYSYLRNFDPWAGHTWAHGFGTFAEGNNLESTSEALNSWNAGYLWALATDDTDRMNAAIYGFVTEISAIKEYWFDYDEENWDPAFGDYVDVAGMVWGGKHDYATWFGANPTFIYGIQWLPTGEYLTNYALNDQDFTKFSAIFATYLEAKNGTIDTWFSNMWAIQAIINPETAIDMFDPNLILNDDYPSELVGTYWMIHALDALGRRTTDLWMEIQLGVAATVYRHDDGTLYAMVWNPSNEQKVVEFYNDTGFVISETVPAKSFTKITLN